MKYIIIEKDGMELALLFPELIQHVEAIKHPNTLDPRCRTYKLVSAGFCSNPTAFPAIRVWGRSDSLNLASRPQDAEIIKFSIIIPVDEPQPAEVA